MTQPRGYNSRVRAKALELAKREALTKFRLMEEAEFDNERTARRWIKNLKAEGLIKAIGYEETKTPGPSRTLWGMV